MTCDSVELTAFRSFIRLGKPLSDFILLRVKEPRRDTFRVGYSSDPASVRVLEQQNQQPYRMIS